MSDLDLSRRAFLQMGPAAFLAGALPGSLAARAEESRSLRSLADDLGILLGTPLSGYNFEAEDRKLRAKYRKIVEREFNMVMIQYGMLWANVEPREGRYDFAFADAGVEWAGKAGLAICGHPLLFGTNLASLPDWLQKARLTKAQMIRRMQEHITRVVTRYKGKIKYWIVVNEPHIPPYRPTDFFVERIGPEYIPIAFEAARAADPAARLILNDTDNHTPAGLTYPLTRRHLKALRGKKPLVDIVGMQMHLEAKTLPAKKAVIQAIKSYGVEVQVTELDINMKGITRDPKVRFALQAKMYRSIVEACLEAGNCKGISVWDFGDQYSWLVKPSPGGADVSPDASPTLFDDDLEPKPAYDAVRDVLQAKVAVRGKKR
jgi:endo-1,4-beta-xylanase